jgi:histidinol-phosphate phosphatase family protein
VIPTIGRPSLARLLDRLAHAPEPRPRRIVVVDDRPGAGDERALTGVEGVLGAGSERRPAGTDGGTSSARDAATRVVVLRSHGRGPAAARNVGWRACTAPWIAFLDDDVLPRPDWTARLADDLRAAGASVGGVQGRVVVPRPAGRAATDWERNVAGLERARWATADLVYRRAALEQVGGFDERFRHNYREDADLGLRVVAAGWRIERGRRVVVHPVGPADWRVSVRLQRGNADDALMRRLHGSDWRKRAGAGQGRLARHGVVVGAALAAVGCAATAMLACGDGERARPSSAGGERERSAQQVRRRAAARSAALATSLWAARTAKLAWARIAPGPRTIGEVATMTATSVALPFAAVGWRLVGELRALGQRPVAPLVGELRALGQRPVAPLVGELRALGQRPVAPRSPGPPAAVLFDRDGTLVEDVPYNGDPSRVMLVPGALDAVATLRHAGVGIAVVSNQSGIARGWISSEQVEAVNERVDTLLGGVDVWLFCPHGPDDGCDCRKPAPGMVRAAARELGVAVDACVVIGDIGADLEAARAAGARGVLVPTSQTRPEEVAAAEHVAPDLLSAVRQLLSAPERQGATGPVAEAAR